MNSDIYKATPITLPSHRTMTLGLMLGEIAIFQLASSINSVSGKFRHILLIAGCGRENVCQR
jgi:hypothetical protein